MENERRKRASERARRTAKKNVARQKAIAGEHSIEAQGVYLANICKELQKTCGRELLPEGAYDLSGLYTDCDEGHLKDCHSAIVNGLQEWMEQETDDAQKAKVLQLSERTKRWVKENVPGWGEFIWEVRQNKAPLPNDIKHYLRHLLGVRAGLKISELLEEYGEVSQEEALQLVFTNNESSEQDYRLRRIRKSLLKELSEQLKSPPVESWIKREFPEEKLDTWPMAWMRRDKRIMENMERKGSQYFFPLINHLFQKGSYMGTVPGRQLTEERGWESNLVLLMPDYGEIERKLGIPVQIARKYLQEMGRWKIVRKLGKAHERGRLVYAIGKWVKGKNSFPSPKLYLKNTGEMRDALRAFDVYWQEKSQK